MRFGFEDLNVWNRATEFAVEIINIIEKIETGRKHFRLFEQLEAAVTSVPMNIAGGKGRYSSKEFIHFCFIARGSLYETITLLEIFKRKGWIPEKEFVKLKSEAIEIASMLKGLINSLK